MSAPSHVFVVQPCGLMSNFRLEHVSPSTGGWQLYMAYSLVSSLVVMHSLRVDVSGYKVICITELFGLRTRSYRCSSGTPIATACAYRPRVQGPSVSTLGRLGPLPFSHVLMRYSTTLHTHCLKV